MDVDSLEVLFEAIVGGFLDLIFRQLIGNAEVSLPTMLLAVCATAVFLGLMEKAMPRWLAWALAGTMVIYFTHYLSLYFAIGSGWSTEGGSKVAAIVVLLVAGGTPGLLALRFHRTRSLPPVYLLLAISSGTLYSFAISNGWMMSGVFGYILGTWELCTPLLFLWLASRCYPLVSRGIAAVSMLMRRTSDLPLLQKQSQRWYQRPTLVCSMIAIASFLALCAQHLIKTKPASFEHAVVTHLPGRLLYAGALSVLVFAGMVLLTSAIWRLAKAMRYQHSPLSHKGLMWSCVSMSRAWVIFNFMQASVPAILMTAGTVCSKGSVEVAAALALFGLALATWLLSRFLVAPAVVFLATSSEPTIQLHIALIEELRPLRVVALLAAEEAGAYHEQYHTRHFFDSMRTTEVEFWRSVVSDLLKASLIVVIDGRTPTPGVIEEAGHLQALSLTTRTIWIAQDDGCCPVYEAVFRKPTERGQTVNAATAPAVVRRKIMNNSSQ